MRFEKKICSNLCHIMVHGLVAGEVFVCRENKTMKHVKESVHRIITRLVITFVLITNSKSICLTMSVVISFLKMM